LVDLNLPVHVERPYWPSGQLSATVVGCPTESSGGWKPGGRSALHRSPPRREVGLFAPAPHLLQVPDSGVAQPRHQKAERPPARGREAVCQCQAPYPPSACLNVLPPSTSRRLNRPR